jgi:hypothetical protein
MTRAGAAGCLVAFGASGACFGEAVAVGLAGAAGAGFAAAAFARETAFRTGLVLAAA